MREIVHIQAGQCGNQIGAKVRKRIDTWGLILKRKFYTFFKIIVVLSKLINTPIDDAASSCFHVYVHFFLKYFNTNIKL